MRTMLNYLLTAAAVAASPMFASPDLPPGPWGDLGDGTYRNPVLVGAEGDIAVCKAGDDYYATHGRTLDVWHSRDLVNWTCIAELDSGGRGSIWAPDICHVDGRFYIYTTFVDRSRPQGVQFDNIVMWADDPAGPWQGPRSLNLFGVIDPGLLVDKDGGRWLYVNKGRVVRMSADGLSTDGELDKVYDGWIYPEDWEVECFCLEGPKFARRGDTYYMLSAEGGTAGPPTAHMVVVARSDSPTGPWINSPYNPLVRTASAQEPWWRQGHGEFTTDAAGNWWMLYTAYNEAVGPRKITLLAPIEWTEDGWPRIPAEFDITKPWPKPAAVEDRPPHLNGLEWPDEGRWSVATGWEAEWPAAWHHADPERTEQAGEWTLSHGRMDLPGGTLVLQDAERLRPDGLRELRRRWEWQGDKPIRDITLSIRLQWQAVAARPFLPGISYYDNPAGQSVDPGRIPVIGNQPGDKGYYEEHRFPMPLAGWEGIVQEGDGATACAVALHTLPSPVSHGDLHDQWWSLGVQRLADDRLELAAYSGAVASNGRTGLIKARQSGFIDYPGATCTLLPGTVIEKTAFLQDAVSTVRGAGFQPLVTASLGLFDVNCATGYPSCREIINLKLQDSLSRYREDEQFAGIDAFPGENRPWIDLGWAGQSEAVAYPFILFGAEHGIPDARRLAQRAMDFITTSPFNAEGFSIRYDFKAHNWLDRRNPLSQGQAMDNMLNALQAARQAGGYDTTLWEAFLARACQLHARRILDPDWRPVSTNEAFLISPLAKGSRLLEMPELLAAAGKAAEHYLGRHLSMDEPYWGGTLDARCEDKEGAWAALQGFLAMYDLTGDERYLDGARHAGGIVLSYLYVWDVPLPAGRLADHAFRSRGWTAVSVQNMHLDVYGVLCAPAIWRLGELTGQPQLKSIARLMLVACGQLTDPRGSAGEQIHQTHYAQHYRPETGSLKGVRGDYIESWTVYWITAHFLTAAGQFREMGVDVLDW